MVLDEDNAVLYFKYRKVKLSEKQNLLLSYLINTPDKCRRMEDVSKYVYKDEEKKQFELHCDYRLSGLIYRVNKKTRPDFEILYKSNKICYINVKPYDKKWLKKFIKNHKKSYILYEKYKQLGILQKEIKDLENNI